MSVDAHTTAGDSKFLATSVADNAAAQAVHQHVSADMFGTGSSSSSL